MLYDTKECHDVYEYTNEGIVVDTVRIQERWNRVLDMDRRG